MITIRNVNINWNRLTSLARYCLNADNLALRIDKLILNRLVGWDISNDDWGKVAGAGNQSNCWYIATWRITRNFWSIVFSETRCCPITVAGNFTRNLINSGSPGKVDCLVMSFLCPIRLDNRNLPRDCLIQISRVNTLWIVLARIVWELITWCLRIGWCYRDDLVFNVNCNCWNAIRSSRDRCWNILTRNNLPTRRNIWCNWNLFIRLSC